MTKIQFEDLPSENTPIIANNLNQMQTNIETAIGNVQTVSRIELDGAVTGDANVPANGNVIITTTQNNIATVSGQLEFNNESYETIFLSYPQGYNKDNCVIIGYKIKPERF